MPAARPVAPSPSRQLAAFLARYDPKIAALGRAVLRAMRARLPGAVELVYDNYNALVIGLGPTERPSEAVFSIVLNPRHVSLVFIRGVDLPDPAGRLQGGGNQVRHIRLESTGTLDEPEVRALLAAALRRAKPFDAAQPRRLIVKAIAKKQRPRRPAGT